MKVDIIGSSILDKASEFKSFPFDINHFILDQSILTLLPKRYYVNTDGQITEDYSKSDYTNDQSTDLYHSISEMLIIDLLSEMNDVYERDNEYYALDDDTSKGESPISILNQFRLLLKSVDNLIDLTINYDRILLLKIIPNEEFERDFLTPIYEKLERKIPNKFVVEIPTEKVRDVYNAPLEFYDSINQALQQFTPEYYGKDLNVSDRINDNELSVFINYLERKEYVYELLFNGTPITQSQKTEKRYHDFRLNEPGEYQVRVDVVDGTMESALSRAHRYNRLKKRKYQMYAFAEMPDTSNLWMLDVVLKAGEFKGLIGSPFKYPEGYKGLDVYYPQEVEEKYLRTEHLLSDALYILNSMDHMHFSAFLREHESTGDPLLLDFLDYIKTKR